jgi:hypothetical protein
MSSRLIQKHRTPKAARISAAAQGKRIAKESGNCPRLEADWLLFSDALGWYCTDGFDSIIKCQRGEETYIENEFYIESMVLANRFPGSWGVMNQQPIEVFRGTSSKYFNLEVGEETSIDVFQSTSCDFGMAETFASHKKNPIILRIITNTGTGIDCTCIPRSNTGYYEHELILMPGNTYRVVSIEEDCLFSKKNQENSIHAEDGYTLYTLVDVTITEEELEEFNI